MAFKLFLDHDILFKRELEFCYKSIFDYYIQEWVKSTIPQMTLRRDSNV